MMCAFAECLAGIVWLVCIGSCGPFPRPPDFEPSEGAIDAFLADGPVIDGPPPRCNPVSSFGAPVPVTELNTDADDEHPRLTADELTVYFSSSRPGGVGGYDIYQATRTSTSAP